MKSSSGAKVTEGERGAGTGNRRKGVREKEREMGDRENCSERMRETGRQLREMKREWGKNIYCKERNRIDDIKLKP